MKLLLIKRCLMRLRQINLTTETITVNELLSQNEYEVNPKKKP